MKLAFKHACAPQPFNDDPLLREIYLGHTYTYIVSTPMIFHPDSTAANQSSTAMRGHAVAATLAPLAGKMLRQRPSTRSRSESGTEGGVYQINLRGNQHLPTKTNTTLTSAAFLPLAPSVSSVHSHAPHPLTLPSRSKSALAPDMERYWLCFWAV